MSPSVQALPSYLQPKASWPQNILSAWDNAVDALELAPPNAPANVPMAELQVWTDEELTPWLEDKSHRIIVARRSLVQETKHDRAFYVMAKALVGLLYEDLGRALSALPIPSDFQSDEEFVEAYRAVLVGKARSQFRVARQAYTVCHRFALERKSMLRWADFCTERAQRLPSDEFAPKPNTQTGTPGPDKTEVEVTKVK